MWNDYIKSMYANKITFVSNLSMLAGVMILSSDWYLGKRPPHYLQEVGLGTAGTGFLYVLSLEL